MEQAVQPFSIGTYYSKDDIVAAWRKVSSVVDFRWMGSHAIIGNTLFVFCGSPNTSEDGTEYYFVKGNLYRKMKNRASSLPESFGEVYVFFFDATDSFIYSGCHQSLTEDLSKEFSEPRSDQNQFFQIVCQGKERQLYALASLAAASEYSLPAYIRRYGRLSEFTLTELYYGIKSIIAEPTIHSSPFQQLEWHDRDTTLETIMGFGSRRDVNPVFFRTTRPANNVSSLQYKPAVEVEVIEKLTEVLLVHFAKGDAG